MSRVFRNISIACRQFPAAFLVLALALLLFGCMANRTEQRLPDPLPVDTTISRVNAFSDLFLDSLAVYRFIGAEKLNPKDSMYLLNFYRQRNFQHAWYDSAGLAEQAYNFVNLFRSYRASVGDTSLWVPAFDSAISVWLNDTLPHQGAPNEATAFELMLTRQFFRYAERAYKGNDQIDLADLGWFIPRKKMDPVAFLDSVIISGGRDIQTLLPVHPLFENLRKALDTYTRLARQHTWQPIQFRQNKYVLGDSAPEIAILKQRLFLLGDLPDEDTSRLFTEELQQGVKQFQQRMGLTADGVPGKSFFAAINVPLEQRIRQILINMERARWIPKPGTGPYLVVNIPEFRLHVFDSGRHQFDMAVVVGKPATHTVIFNGMLQYVVFAPYWNVPYSIVKNEMGRSASYFARRNMEIVGRYADGLPMVRQKPGPSNALGRVKFLFPNSYSIYLHDTPSKGLFGQSTRAFSHGCIRVEQPEKLARWVLRFNADWPADKITEGLSASREITVNVLQPVPVFIGYFTCFFDRQGRLHFRNDLYGHDAKMAERLFPPAN